MAQKHGGRPNLKSVVAQTIRDDILRGRLRPGDRIDQDGMAEALGISRIPVREGLITLETEGLVTITPHRGAFVAALLPRDIKDHFEMYGALSGLAARRAATGEGDPLLVERLRRANAKLRQTDDPSELDSLNFEFHRLINQAGSSERLLSVLRMLSASMPTHFFQPDDVQSHERSYREHERIIAAIAAGDGDEAARAVAEHFEATGTIAISALDRTGFWSESESREALA